MGGRYDWCQLLRCLDSSGASWRTPGRGCCNVIRRREAACSWAAGTSNARLRCLGVTVLKGLQGGANPPCTLSQPCRQTGTHLVVVVVVVGLLAALLSAVQACKHHVCWLMEARSMPTSVQIGAALQVYGGARVAAASQVGVTSCGLVGWVVGCGAQQPTGGGSPRRPPCRAQAP